MATDASAIESLDRRRGVTVFRHYDRHNRRAMLGISSDQLNLLTSNPNWSPTSASC